MISNRIPDTTIVAFGVVTDTGNVSVYNTSLFNKSHKLGWGGGDCELLSFKKTGSVVDYLVPYIKYQAYFDTCVSNMIPSSTQTLAKFKSQNLLVT